MSDKLKDDVTGDLAAGFQWDERQNEIKCQEPACNARGNVKCIIPDYFDAEKQKDEPDLEEYLCANHAAENGYCTGCGIFIAGLEISITGSLCENCIAEINQDYQDEDFDDAF